MTGAPAAVQVLQGLLGAEHAAVYGYGVLGARLDDATRPQALDALGAHKQRRDALAALLTARRADAPGPLPAYDVTVVGQPAALALAVRLEEGLAVRWRDLVGATDEESLRRLGTGGLTETAVRAAQWRRTLGVRPPTVPMPGTTN